MKDEFHQVWNTLDCRMQENLQLFWVSFLKYQCLWKCSKAKKKHQTNKQTKNIFMRFHLHANLNVYMYFKFSFSRIFRKVKKYSIISMLWNKPFSFALYIYMLCIIWVHVKRSWFNYMYIAISCDSLETRRTSEKIIVHENKWTYHLLHDAFSTCLSD